MRQRFESLDAFRGLAALSIVILHLNLVGSVTELKFFQQSEVFVDFFFVLSGFVLTHGYGAREGMNFLVLMRARFFRLYPLHFCMFVVFLLLEFCKFAAYKYGGFTFNDLPFTGGTAVSEIVPNLLLVQSWVPFTEPKSFNYPAWSISIEFYLYALFFLSLIVFSRLKPTIWLFITFAAFYLIVSESEMLTSAVLKGLSCFFGGALTYLLYRKMAHIRIAKSLANIVEVVLVVIVVMIVQSDFKYQNIAITILFYFVILFFAFEAGMVSNCLKLKPFQEAGKLSYSIYMTHAAVLFCLMSAMIAMQKFTGLELAPMLHGKRYLTFGNEILNNLIVLLVLGVVILISQFTYKYIEIKWQKKGKAILP